MLSGDWVTPKLPLPEGIQAYQGKPPLHFWQTAVAMLVFGMDAWVTRLPSVFAWLLIGACSWIFTTRLVQPRSSLLAASITLSSGLLFFLAGSSTVDVTFSAWISAALTAFALCAAEGRTRSPLRTVSGYAFFLFSAFAFLTKGPAGLVLIGLALFGWLCFKDSRKLFPTLPWVGGTILALAIAVPWFVISEQRDPGFLHYFFVQENFLRFVSKDYGDRFGTGHVYPRGSAVWMLLVAFMPWTLIIAGLLLFSSHSRELLRSRSPWVIYALCWGLAPTFFFSFARQLHAAYVIPGIGGLGVIAAVLIDDSRWEKLAALLRLLTILLLIVAAGCIPAGFFFHSGIAAAVIGLLIVAAGACYISRSLKLAKSSVSALAFSFIFSLTTLYAVVFVAFSTHAGRIKSSRILLTQIAESLNGKDEQVVFLGHNAYSFYYYPRDWQRQIGAPVRTGYQSFEQILKEPPAHLAVNKADISRIPLELAQRYTEEVNLGKWRWWRLKSADESVQ